jgi:hypothetical protein
MKGHRQMPQVSKLLFLKYKGHLSEALSQENLLQHRKDEADFQIQATRSQNE